jgi:hypothetical protein
MRAYAGFLTELAGRLEQLPEKGWYTFQTGKEGIPE